MKPITISNENLLASSSARWTSRLIRGVVNRLADSIERGTLRLTLPDGSSQELTGALSIQPVADLQIHHPRALRRLVIHGDIGFAEGYLANEWSSSNLTALFGLGIANEEKLENLVGNWSSTRLIARIKHLLNANSRRQAKKNIAYHYDLGNEFYKLWLDSSMTYSAGIFSNGLDESETSLEASQHAKYARLANALEIEDHHSVLEIGCGWGGFMQHVIENTKATIAGVSISQEQCQYASQRLHSVRGGDRAQVLFRDYRDLEGTYDRVASIEMFEAVGEKCWQTYAQKLKSLLAEKGIAALQVITINENRFERYKDSADFIQRYIFPGGMLPSYTALNTVMRDAGLKITDSFRFGPHYAESLRRWRTRFDAAWPAIEAQGFDERFKRMWHYYLAYCEIGFDTGATDVVQIRVEHDS
ncbi:MAG: class I SAM-dependent methyltransferase [Gammaproteobacteria bacterium]